MNVVTRLFAAVPGLVMLLNGVGFLVDPAAAVESLGMTLLDGVGKSTQVADLAAFFIATAIFVFIGASMRAWQWLCAGALLLGLAATFRTMVFLFHDAPFATQFIVAEIVMVAWLLGFAFWFSRESK